MLNATKPGGGNLRIKHDELTNVSVVRRQSRFINSIHIKQSKAVAALNLRLSKMAELSCSQFAFCSKYH
jgi:hypothetical protein